MLEVSHISKTFNAGTVNEKRALSDLSLRLADGEFATIVGSNGAGKSTLFNAIAGSFYVDKGRILLNGKDITFTREHNRSRVIGRLFQDPLRGTAPHMSIEENLALAYLRAAHGNPFSRITARDRELFRAQLAQLDMGLEDRLGQPVGLLSGGQRQALTLLMATMVPPELLLLDIMLPDTDGLAIMRRLRADRLTATVPIMMLTAKDTELDKVMALDGGADDYLTKPFSLMELASRCRALLRRGGMVKQASDVLSVGDIVLSPSHREVTVAGEPLKLTLREFDLLEYLMRKPGVVFTRESLLQSVWGWDFDGGSRTVDVHVQTLRQKLGERAGAIETVRGVGYRLAEPSADGDTEDAVAAAAASEE